MSVKISMRNNILIKCLLSTIKLLTVFFNSPAQFFIIQINMDYGYPCYYPFPHPFDPTFMYPPFPYEFPEPGMSVKMEEAEEPVEDEEIKDIECTNKSVEFLEYFELELRKKSVQCIKYVKKVWTQQEYDILIDMKKKNYKWTQIAEKIPNTNWQVCKRKYHRLKQDQERWPRELDAQIKRVCENQNLKWEKKMNILRGKFPRGRKYSRKMVKERYLLYLKDQIRQKPWTVEEDMFLINMLAKGVKRWRMIADVFPGRTELHLKNRYYGYLREIERKVEKMMEKKLQKNKVKREA